MRAPIPILTYHQVDAAPAEGTPYRSLVVSPGTFAKQMGLLKALGYRGLSMTAPEPYLRGEKSGKVVGITLDDGYVNNLEHALPVLQHCGFSATCYVVSSQLGGLNFWDRAKGVPPQPLMDAAQLRAWIAGGQVRLTAGAAEVAWTPARNNLGLYFWGEAPDSLYSAQNIYRLTIEKGTRMASVALEAWRGPCP